MNHADLDEQIRAALKVEPSPQQLARLETYWQRQTVAEQRRRHIRRTAALATTVAVAVGVSAWHLRREPAHQSLEEKRLTQVAPNAPKRDYVDASDPNHDDAPEVVLAVQSPREERSLSAGRPPTTYERFLFAARSREPVVNDRPSVVATVDAVIEQMTCDRDADAEQLAKSSGLVECNAERLLLRRLLRSSGDEKRAALRLLAVCGTPRSMPHLLRLSRSEVLRDEALATIERIVGIEGLADVVGQTNDQRVRATLLHRLLTADSESALRGFLSLVHHDTIRAEALAAADAAAEPLLPQLLALLKDEDETEAVRMSAALVLGHVNGPDVTNSLITLVTQERSSPTEAWIALFACRGAQVEEFFAYAMRQPQLLGQVNRARVRWASMIP